MEKYVKPVMDVEMFSVDVISTSGGACPQFQLCDDELPILSVCELETPNFD